MVEKGDSYIKTQMTNPATSNIQYSIPTLYHITSIRTDHSLLRHEFNKLEAGRLTKLEAAFSISETKNHLRARHTAVLFSSITTVAISVVSAIIFHYLGL